MANKKYAISWDETGERWFQNGVRHGVLYLMKQDGTYEDGEAWNGLRGVDENPDGGDVTDLWADNIKYASFRNPENYGGNVKAYTYPDGWKLCDGQKTVDGVNYGGQKRQPFGLCYRTELSNDTGAEEYQIHLIWNSTVSPSSQSHATKSENPDAEEMSWDFKSTPVNVEGVDGVETASYATIDSRDHSEAEMEKLLAYLYGTPASGGQEAVPARLPAPGEIATIMA